MFPFINCYSVFVVLKLRMFWFLFRICGYILKSVNFLKKYSYLFIRLIFCFITVFGRIRTI